jgi:signal transduction histidine kinase
VAPTQTLAGDRAAQADRGTREGIDSVDSYLQRYLHEIAERTDRLFFWILLAEWLAAILIVMRGPPPGCNVDPSPVWAAVVAGGAIVSWPMYVARTNPGERANRRQIAIAQAFMACLLVHFSRGRTEIHLAAIASFVFVALYRDVRILLLSTGIIAADHLLGSYFWAEALYGPHVSGPWVWVRHVGRLSVEDLLLILAIHKSRQELERSARRTATIESHQTLLEREVADRQRTEGLLSVQYSLTRLLATSSTLREASPEMLRIVGDSHRWDIGELWEVDERALFLRCVDLWHASDSTLPANLLARRRVELRPEEELPGQVWNRHLPLWIADVADEPNMPLAALREQEGLHGALAIPLRNGPDVVGVMAFYSRQVRPADDEHLSMVSALGGQIGQFMDRKRIEQGLRLAHAELESSVEKRTKQLRETNEKLHGEVKERERVQRELISAKELADSANQAKSAFLANMSHELRTPLNSVIGFSELLEQEIFGTLTDKQKSYVGNVLISGRHLLQLVNDILDISKVEAGRMDLVCEWTHLGTIVDIVKSVIQAQATKKGINLEVSISDKLPELYIDPGRIKQVLYNLVSNGIKFTPRGGTVRLTAYLEDDRIAIEVADTGVGIAAENLPRLFREFEQIAQARGVRPEGTGLGLALTRRLVGLHGGEVAVESKVGQGSIFSVWLPWRARDGAPAAAGAAAGSAPWATPAPKPMSTPTPTPAASGAATSSDD